MSYLQTVLAFIMFFFACGKQMNITTAPAELEMQEYKKLSYLALGDSYTIGESVAVKKSFPKQLEKRLETDLNVKIKTDIVAKTGWRTDNLLNAISVADLETRYDFVTLLIGVNNQYQGTSFAKYEKEFQKLLATAIKFANNEVNRVIVVSIPDWGFTPYGKNRDRQKISSEIDTYNTLAKSIAISSGVRFVEITDITRTGLEHPELIAQDGLHPSGEAYELFVKRIAPIISTELKD